MKTNETNKKVYVAPTLEVVEVELEEGIAQTSGGAGTSSIDTFSRGFTDGAGDSATGEGE